ncbi:MAG: GNAT family N-acetyltransferase [Bacteroidota bacterium]
MQNIQKITAIETFPVRHPILRSGKPIATCHFDGDDLTTTTHFGLFIEENLIGVISIFEMKNPLFTADKQFQIRGMAVLEELQKKGFGADLVAHAEHFITSQKGNLIWFNARINAVGFYEKLGYTIIGNAFEIEGVGTHYVLYKEVGAL